MALRHGVNPKMIQTGSSGSYFIQTCLDANGNVTSASSPPDAFAEAIKEKRIRTVAVFKPNDEEPYGNLNPKRVFLRRYLWWAMGRPCLIASFSYLSEVGASLLDERLQLSLVPSTRLVELSSQSFSYLPKQRKSGIFHEKIGSYQNYLQGYVNASTFLRAHPWPSRPRNLLEQDLEAENHAHGRARARARKGKGKGAKTAEDRKRGCLSFVEKLNCCASASIEEDEYQARQAERRRSVSQTAKTQLGFTWTKDLMQVFRLELEKLVCFDYLIRNTDRGLDNFMVKVEQFETSEEHPSEWKLSVAAIDNSLAFPWKHPAGIRSYPWGWLYLPTDLIGGNFSNATRELFIPFLSSASWWNETKAELERLFRKDDHFDEKKFQGQMEVIRGQGWNLLESLRSDEEGPLELCARQKQMVKQATRVVEEAELPTVGRECLALTPAAHVISSKLGLGRGLNEGGSALARPIVVKSGEVTQSAAKDVLQPRSLPETIDDEQVSHRWKKATVIDDISGETHKQRTAPIRGRSSENVREDEAIGKAYRGKSLGIEVLTEIDKSTSKSKRPNLRKAFTGHSSRNTQSRNERRRAAAASLASEVSEREESLDDSVASLPGPSPASGPLLARRRRNGSVGDVRSISSVLERSYSHEVGEEGARRMQVIIEVGVVQ